MDPEPRRYLLQELLQEVSGFDEEHVHFQPPANTVMDWPCIVYERDSAKHNYADNITYRFLQRYQVTVISRDPDEPALAKIAALPMCTTGTHFKAEKLNHDTFNVFF